MLELLATFLLVISLGAPPDSSFESRCASSCDPPIVVSGG